MSDELEWLTLAFTVSNSIRAMFYLPQIVAIARSTDGARNIALSTWWMWTMNNLLGALYTGVAVRHAPMALSFAASAACCLATIALTLLKRRNRKRLATARGCATAAIEGREDFGSVQRPFEEQAAALPWSRPSDNSAKVARG